MKHERLVELLRYDQEDGLFSWRVARGPRSIGEVAGTLDSDGYCRIQVDGRFFAAHRLAWFYVHTAWPTGEIDHIDGNRTNNRISNLRDVSPAVNKQNIRQGFKSKIHSPLLGAQWYERSKKWRAVITANGRRVFLGYFDSDQQAHEAYVSAKRKLHEGCTL